MAYIGKIPSAAALTSSDLSDDIVTLAKMAGGTDGNIITYDASGNPAVVATGSDGQVLTSTGAGSPPAFEAASGGNFIKITTETISANTASVTFDGDFSSTYKNYFVIGSAIRTDDAGPNLRMRFRESSADVTGSYYVSTRNTVRLEDSTGAMEEDNNSLKDSYFGLSATFSTGNDHDGHSAKRAINFNFHLHDPLNTSYMKYYFGSGHHTYDNGNDVWYYHHHIGGTYYASAAALTGFTIYPSAGNFDAGTISLFGLKH